MQAGTSLPSLLSLDREGPRQRVVFVASPGAYLLEMMGPMSVLLSANAVLEESGRPDLGYAMEVVASQPGSFREIPGLQVQTDRPFASLRGVVDTLLFAPMPVSEVFQLEPRFLAWVDRMAKTRTRRVASICAGAFILAEAGLLDGRRATTHWMARDDFAARYPDVDLDIEAIYVQDGPIHTSAGASASVDMTLALVEEDFGSELARRVAQDQVLFLKRPGSQAQFSEQLRTRLPEDQRFAELKLYIYEHLAADLRIDALAARMGMSRRNFSRVFTREIGVAPGRFVERCRLERARQHLAESRAPLSEVAADCGYDTSDAMRVAFERGLGISPRAYRQRFATALAS